MEDSAPAREEPSESAMRRFAKWATLISGFATGLAFIVCGVLAVFLSARFHQIMLDHFAATIGLPSALLASACIVLIIESRAGPIEFEGVGFKFKGASGPIVLCAGFFLVIVAAIKLLW